MQLYLKQFYNILRQQNNFEWTTEHQIRFEKSKNFALNKFQSQFQILINHFLQCAMLQTLASKQLYYNPIMEPTK